MRLVFIIRADIRQAAVNGCMLCQKIVARVLKNYGETDAEWDEVEKGMEVTQIQYMAYSLHDFGFGYGGPWSELSFKQPKRAMQPGLYTSLRIFAHHSTIKSTISPNYCQLRDFRCS
jgi:hypothetical protein